MPGHLCAGMARLASAAGRWAKRPVYLVAALVPLCLLATLVSERQLASPVELLAERSPALQAASDLEQAARLELASAGNHQLAPTHLRPARQGARSAHVAVAAPARAPPMDTAASRSDLNGFFDRLEARTRAAAHHPAGKHLPRATAATHAAADKASAAEAAAKLAAWKAGERAGAKMASAHDTKLEARIKKQDSEISQLKKNVKDFEASMKKEEQKHVSEAKASRAKLAEDELKQHELADKLEQERLAKSRLAHHVQEVERQAEASTRQAVLGPEEQMQAARAEAERALGEAVRDHSHDLGSSAPQITRDLAKLLAPQPAVTGGTPGATVVRDQFGVPQVTSEEKGKLLGVNVDMWSDPRVEHAVAPAVWQKEHPLFLSAGSVKAVDGGAEGGAQLASFGVPAAAPACNLDHCAFLADCSLNQQARGFHRASGLMDDMPAFAGTITPYGGGGTHTSTLKMREPGAVTPARAEAVGGVPSNQPLWDRYLPSDLQEGGQQLASFGLPPPAAAPPPPVVCECPKCKLGQELVGPVDEVHEKVQVADPDLLQTIDDELMKLDPQYAARRMDGITTPGLVEKTISPRGRANPLSDFTDVNPPDNVFGRYNNQVADKTGGMWKADVQALSQKPALPTAARHHAAAAARQ